MSDFPAVLNETFSSAPAPFESLPAWRGVLETFRAEAVPHCWAVRAPAEWHEGILEAMSRLYLEAAAPAWRQDMTVVGEFGKPGNVEACRAMIKELHMKPAFSARRLGVVLAADKLLIHAANCLLKVAEEPPSHACLLFLMEGGDFLPTLKSRSRVTVLAAPPASSASPMPCGDALWADWLGSLDKDADMAELLSAWTSHFLVEGGVDRAAKTDRLRLLVQQKKLSQTMVCDLLILTLKEELPFELISGGFR